MIFAINGNSYDIYITSQSLPTLEEVWTEVELGPKKYSFRRSSKKSRVFPISGYVQQDTFANTEAYARAFNDDIIANPAGVLTDGYSNEYICYITSWNFDAVVAQNKYTFTLSLRIVEDAVLD
jgi:hypothetical protein